MNKQFSDLWSINKKEVLIGLVITVVVALIDLTWTGINPIIVQWQATQVLDLTLFTTKVNLGTIWDTATVTAMGYVMVIFSSGTKKTK